MVVQMKKIEIMSSQVTVRDIIKLIQYKSIVNLNPTSV